jgi:hypothetical protein
MEMSTGRREEGGCTQDRNAILSASGAVRNGMGGKVARWQVGRQTVYGMYVASGSDVQGVER